MLSVHWNDDEKKEFLTCLQGWNDTPQALSMKSFIQHGKVTTYDHCMSVARLSYLMNRRMHLHADETSLIRGAFLHDFYLYDWHHCREQVGRWHGFRHPGIALQKAEDIYPLNNRERNIIRSHMWPLTLHVLPTCREAAVVCVADKLCSAKETLLKR